jgi:NAD dependent epimerase/dehydratase family enzyme
VIINLAGENLSAGLWTSERKKIILNSRINAAQALRYAIESCSNKPGLFIQASAIGIYGISDTLVMNEMTQPGGDYLAEVGKQ